MSRVAALHKTGVGEWEGAYHREYRVKGVIWDLQSRTFEVIKVRNQGI